jgi:hypothetical protein
VAQFPDAAQTFAQFRAAPQTISQVLPDWEVSVVVKDTVLGATSSPNVVGIIEGTDPQLKHEYIVFSGHNHVASRRAGRTASTAARTTCVRHVGIVSGAQPEGRGPEAVAIFLMVSGREGPLGRALREQPPVPLRDRRQHQRHDRRN